MSESEEENRYKKDTGVDVAVSMLLPPLGLIIGIVALCKGEKKRASTMIWTAIGIFIIIFCGTR